MFARTDHVLLGAKCEEERKRERERERDGRTISAMSGR